MSKRRVRRRVPGKDEWLGFEADLDVRYAHRLLFGKTIDEVQPYFAGGRSIERASELLFMPRGAFRYYVQAFAQFLLSDAARGDSDAASSFLNLLGDREERDPGSVVEIYEDLEEAVAFVGAHQEHFEVRLVQREGGADPRGVRSAIMSPAAQGARTIGGSGPCRSRIPEHADHRFRSKAITDSGASRSLNA